MITDIFSCPPRPVCCQTEQSNVGKSVFLLNLNLNNINEYDKIYIYSTSLHQNLYQKLIKCFSNYILFHIIRNLLNVEDIDIVIDELINNKVFQKSDTEMETFDPMEELKYPREYKNNSIIILDDLNEKKINNDKIQAIFKRGRHSNLSIIIVSQGYYELPKRKIRTVGNIHHIFRPNKFGDVQKINQDKSSNDMTLNEYKLLTFTCWNEKYPPLTIDMT